MFSRIFHIVVLASVISAVYLDVVSSLNDVSVAATIVKFQVKVHVYTNNCTLHENMLIYWSVEQLTNSNI